MRKILLLLLLATLGARAQQRISDIPATQSYHSGRQGVRPMSYHAVDGAFRCHDGEHRFTRALYGGPTAYRLETSDRPVFALFQDSRHCRNVSFRATCGGRTVALDSTQRCVATYERGRRVYELSDPSWRGGRIVLTALCQYDREGAVWEFRHHGFRRPLVLEAVLRPICARQLSRNGDLGVDAADSFEADGQPLQQLSWAARGDSTYLEAEGLTLLGCTDHTKAHYDAAFAQTEMLAGRIVFSTPDPYVNTLGSALTFAADGAWDGHTWLHGAVGWRMELAGWRGAYAGDVLGWPDRARSHFLAYAASQVTRVPPTVPHPTQDAAQQMARAEKRWGTQMYSNGYLCRKPMNDSLMHHYDMNLCYVDELLWHFQFDADTTLMRRLWPLLVRHLDWEERNFDPDHDGLYDAYCCIWASDALYYSGGAVTHATAYNYRANLLAARIARCIGQDAAPYERRARHIRQALDQTLWMDDRGHWAEYKDTRGLQRLHPDAALWSVYTPIDCGACTPEQAWRAMGYVSRCLPHLSVTPSRSLLFGQDEPLQTVATSDWMPYAWSINNVAAAEVMHTALAYFQSGRPREGFRLLKANVVDQMFMGSSPGNFGQVSALDAARGECYRDFADCTGIAARALVQGLFGIVPQALDGLCLVRPGLPEPWDSASVHTPYLSYRFRRSNGTDTYTISQRFRHPLRIVVRQNLGGGRWLDHEGTADSVQVISFATRPLPDESDAVTGTFPPLPAAETLGLADPTAAEGVVRTPVSLARQFNASVSDIFNTDYRHPRPATTTLQIPLQGVGEWCHPHYRPEIADSGFRALLRADAIRLDGVPFLSPRQGRNVAFTSLWDNYPDSISIPLRGTASRAYLLLAGTTNHMQTRLENARVTVAYRDGTADTLRLIPPYNWCPIEQDYYVDGLAFRTVEPRPLRLCLANGLLSRRLGDALGVQGVYGRELPGGAALMLNMPLHPGKKLKSLTLRTLSCDVVAGLMALTLENDSQ